MKWIITGFFGIALTVSLAAVLRIRWIEVAAVGLVTVLAVVFEQEPQIVIGIVGLSVITLRSGVNGRFPHRNLPNKLFRFWR